MKTPKRSLINALLAATLCAALGLLLWASTLFFLRTEAVQSRTETTLYQNTLNAGLKRYAHLPFVLSQDPFVKVVTQTGHTEALSRRLKDFALSAELEAIYMMDMTGLTIAASNFDQEQTFLGKNYGFRSYFIDASQGRFGQFFAIGATTGRPGYFMSAPVRNASGDITGVIAIKVDLSSLGASWPDTDTVLFVSNADDVIVASSRPDWQYKTVTAPTDAAMSRLRAARQFGNEPLDTLDWTQGWIGPNINGVSFIQTTASLDVLDWELHYLTPMADVWRKVGVTMMTAIFALIIVGTIWLYLRSRKIGQALRISQEDRRKLRSINTKLETEIEVRRAAEAKLETAQKELRRTSKLAALGQLSASVTHELGQPLSALKTHITAAEISGRGDAGLLSKLGNLVARMESLTTDLRFFAKPGNDTFDTTDLNAIAQGALSVVEPQFQNSATPLAVHLAPDPVWVSGNRLRLEQVVVNLLSNALTAVKGLDTRHVTLNVDATGTLSVTDNGVGLQGRGIDELTEPFHTTQASGDGLGLGLAISAEIMRDHAGSLSTPRVDTGARFDMKLPLVELAKAAE